MVRSAGWWGLLLGALLGCAGEAPDGSPAVAGFDPGPVPAAHAEGSEVYRANCSGCHGPAGAGFRGGPPLLDSLYLLPRFPDSAIRRAVVEGAPRRHWDFDDMPPVRTVAPGEIPALTGYIRWVQERWARSGDQRPSS